MLSISGSLCSLREEQRKEKKQNHERWKKSPGLDTQEPEIQCDCLVGRVTLGESLPSGASGTSSSEREKCV